MGGDQWPAVDVGVGVYADADFVSRDVECGGVAFVVEVFEFDVGLVGSGSDGFDVDAEEHVAHGGVSDGDELDDLAASDF